jgi:potassium-dependent mechanosensitive channel
VLRVPAPIIRFVRITPSGLEFELFVFVARLEDRVIVANDLNKAILEKLIELKIVDPNPVPAFKLHGIEHLAKAGSAQSDGRAAPAP